MAEFPAATVPNISSFLLEHATALNGGSLKQETQEERTSEQPNEVVFCGEGFCEVRTFGEVPWEETQVALKLPKSLSWPCWL